MTEIRIEGNIDRGIVTQIVQKIESNFPAIKVQAGRCIAIKGFIGGAESLAIIGGVAGIIQAVIALWDLYDQKKAQTLWTYERALNIVRDAMAARQVTDFSVKSMEGFEHLLARDGTPCVLVIKDNKHNSDFEIMIFLNGNIHVFEVR